MTEYSDVPQVNALYTELEKVNNSIVMIDSGQGTMTHFTIGNKPVPPGTTPVVTMMATQIALPGPATDTTMTEIRAQLVLYQTDLISQLNALGVTTTPPVARSA